MQFSQSYNFSLTEGKKLTVGEAEVSSKDSKGTVEIHWDEAEILRAGKLCKFTSKNSDEEYIGLVNNPWFEGAYGIPSFTCSVVFNLKTDTVSFRFQTFRFRNVLLQDAENPELLENQFNTILRNKYGRCYCPSIGAVKLLEPRANKGETYWYIGNERGVLCIKEAVDNYTEADNTRYESYSNYFLTKTLAEERLSQLMTTYL